MAENYQTERARRQRCEVVALLGGRCKRCGFDDPRALQIDHINGGGVQELRAKGGSGHSAKVAKFVRENPAQSKYQLLCANCNWIKRAENGEVRGSNQHDKAKKAARS